jgi:hypothetical protein
MAAPSTSIGFARCASNSENPELPARSIGVPFSIVRNTAI